MDVLQILVILYYLTTRKPITYTFLQLKKRVSKSSWFLPEVFPLVMLSLLFVGNVFASSVLRSFSA